MYAVIFFFDESRTLATFLKAELGFFGDIINTFMQWPRLWGDPRKAGVRVFFVGRLLVLLVSCSKVGISKSAQPQLNGEYLQGCP